MNQPISISQQGIELTPTRRVHATDRAADLLPTTFRHDPAPAPRNQRQTHHHPRTLTHAEPHDPQPHESTARIVRERERDERDGAEQRGAGERERG